jgi:CheY-like chemotaxis protein
MKRRRAPGWRASEAGERRELRKHMMRKERNQGRDSAQRILCVDDDVMVQSLLRRLLERQGFICEIAATGEEAIMKFGQAAPDWFVSVITDHEMPGLSGLELVERLRRLNADVKIIVFASVLTSEVHAAYRALAVAAILEKPADVEVLLRLQQIIAPPPADVSPQNGAPRPDQILNAP